MAVKIATEGVAATYDRITTLRREIERKKDECVPAEHTPLSPRPSSKRHKRQSTGSTQKKGE